MTWHDTDLWAQSIHDRSQQLRAVLQKNLVSKGPIALDGQQKILFADVDSLAMLAWVLHHGGTSSICLEKHAMVAAPQGEYISNQMSPLCDFWLASAIGRGQPIEVAVEVHKLQEWNLKDLHAQRCSLRVEDDIIYLDAEIAQAQAHLETLRTYRTSVFWCFFDLLLLAELPFFSNMFAVSEKKPALDQELFGW